MSARRPPGLRVVTAFAVGLALLTAGCDVSAVHHLRGRATVVNALAAALDRYKYSAYRADYTLADGSVAVVAHGAAPQRGEYLFDSGRYVIVYPSYERSLADPRAPVTVFTCTGWAARSDCVRTDGDPDRHAQPDLPAIARVSRDRFVPVQKALSLVTAAATDDRATLATRRVTVAGQRARCVTVSYGGRTRFDTCVTTRGALASFRGDADGHHVDVTMTAYRRSGLGVAFAAPHGARVTDRRGAD